MGASRSIYSVQLGEQSAPSGNILMDSAVNTGETIAKEVANQIAIAEFCEQIEMVLFLTGLRCIAG
jgi:hypothetical protein